MVYLTSPDNQCSPGEQRGYQGNEEVVGCYDDGRAVRNAVQDIGVAKLSVAAAVTILCNEKKPQCGKRPFITSRKKHDKL